MSHKAAGFAFLPRTDLSKRPEIVVRHDLPVRTTSDTLNGAKYRHQLRGDDIIGGARNADLRPFTHRRRRSRIDTASVAQSPMGERP